MERKIEMSVRIVHDGYVISAYLKGELDHHSLIPVRTEIDTQLQLCSPTLLLLDFSEVSFMDSSGIGLILGRMRVMDAIGGRVAITNPNDYAAKLIRLAGLSSLILEPRKDKKS